MFKTMLATLIVKTGIGYYLIQEIKLMNSRIGVKVEDNLTTELIVAAVIPNWLFLFTTILALMLVYGIKILFKTRETV